MESIWRLIPSEPAIFVVRLSTDISHRSRALAIASAKGSMSVMALRDIHELRSAIDTWSPRDASTMVPCTEVGSHPLQPDIANTG